MSEYKRMTKRDEWLQRVYMDECFGCEPTHCATCPINDAVWDRLAELEDKIEQGTLKEIPEGAVVLTKEEYEKLEALKGDYVKGYEAGVDEGWNNAVTETAEKFASVGKE